MDYCKHEIGFQDHVNTLFKSALRKYPLTHVFYSLEELLVHNSDTN